MDTVERTTIVSFDTGSDDDRAELFTSSPYWQSRMDILVSENPECEVIEIMRDPEGRVIGKHYSFPQRIIMLEGVG